MIRLKTVRVRLTILVIAIVIALVSACGAKKKSLKEQIKYQEQINENLKASIDQEKAKETAVNSNLTVQAETKNYGDSLKGSQPIDTNGVVIESAGIKLNAKLTPIKDNKGNVKGYNLNYNIVAKPTSKTNSNSLLTTNATTKEASNTKTKIEQENKAKAQLAINRDERDEKKAFSFPGWLYALVGLVALIAAILFFKPIINFIKSWKK